MSPLVWWQTRCWFFSTWCFFLRQGAGNGRGPPPHRGRPRGLLSLSVAKGLPALEKPGSDKPFRGAGVALALVCPLLLGRYNGPRLVSHWPFQVPLGLPCNVCVVFFVVFPSCSVLFSLITRRSRYFVASGCVFCILCWSSVALSATVSLFILVFGLLCGCVARWSSLVSSWLRDGLPTVCQELRDGCSAGRSG